MLNAAREHRAHAIGMSGLLVKSTVVMRENLEEMSRQGLEIPVLLGGAALTRNYVEDDCVRAYALRPRRLCARRVRRAAPDGQGDRQRLRRLPRGGAGAARSASRATRARTLGQADARAFRPVDVAAVQAAAAAADAGRGGADAAVLGRARARGAAEGDRAVHERAQPLPVPVGIPQTGPLAGGFPRLGEAGAAPGDAAHAGAVRGRGHPAPAGGLRLLEGGGPGQRPDRVRRRRRAPSWRASRCRGSRRRTASASPISSATSTRPSAT